MFGAITLGQLGNLTGDLRLFLLEIPNRLILEDFGNDLYAVVNIVAKRTHFVIQAFGLGSEPTRFR